MPHPSLKNSVLVISFLPFISPAFQAMDFVFRNDGPNFMQLRGTTMEKLGHLIHMQEVW
jgi:hypothetical protein